MLKYNDFCIKQAGNFKVLAIPIIGWLSAPVIYGLVYPAWYLLYYLKVKNG